MNHTPAELDELIGAYFDATATDQQVQRLSAILRHDDAARTEYLRLAAVHAGLATDTTLWMASDPAAAPSSPFRGVGAWRIAAIFALAAACLTIAIAWWRSAGASHAPSAPAVATLILAADCRWQGSTGMEEGTRLPAGVIDLRSGMAILRFDGGATMMLRNRTRLELRTAGEARLIVGDVIVRAPEEAAGFKLLTPASRMTDLGTEFAVKVEHSGATELHVLEGRVAYEPVKSRGESGTVLSHGKAVRFDAADTQPREVAVVAESFEHALRQAPPGSRPDLMRAYDGFFYDPGFLPLSLSTRGKGWKGPWRLRNTSERRAPDTEPGSPTLHIVKGQMNVTWPVPGGRLGMLQMPPGQTYLVRELAQPIRMDRDVITYFSIMVREPDHTPLDPAARPREGIRLTLRSSDDYFGPNVSFGVGASLQPQIQTGEGMGFLSPIPAPSDQTTLWVGKIIARHSGEDEIFFRIYGEHDALDYAEPATWHVVSRNVRQNARFNLVLLTSTGNAPRIVDELRIGPTWRSVAPIHESTPAASAP